MTYAADVLLPFGSYWRYRDDGNLPTNNWYTPVIDDNNWKSGSGPFGYGQGGEATLIGFGPNPSNKFVTTYFRTWLSVDNPSNYSSLTFSLRRDDGAVVYLNGVELHRSNMTDDQFDNSTYALEELTFPAETNLDVTTFPASLLYPGANLIAVEVHQASPSTPDMSFDLQVEGAPAATAPAVIRGPYLQVGTSSNLVVRWRTDLPTSTRVRYGTSADSLTLTVADTLETTEHEILLTRLTPATRYFYEIGTVSGALAGDASYTFVTAPVPGTIQPVRIWAIGDFGTGFQAQYDVRDAYTAFTGTRNTDVWLMLGDNAYYSGFDYQYQSYVFDIYPALLRRTIVWPTVGNHDTDQDMSLSDNFPYYQIFTMPTMGQAGGVPSGTKHYYSFDYANIHFICLDSMTTIYRQASSDMCRWLEADLAETTRDWIIAFWHHPAYSHGTHNSDTEQSMVEMRQNIVPILEAGGVDVAMFGHSHNYERSYLIDGQYDDSFHVDPTNFVDHGSGRTNDSGAYLKPAGGMGIRRGAVYLTDGSSGGQSSGGPLDHPVMYYSTYDAGSLVLDVAGQRLDATFIRADGAITDYFTIDKGNTGYNLTNSNPRISLEGTAPNLVASWPTSPMVDYGLRSRHGLETPGPWGPVPGPVSVVGRRKYLPLQMAPTNEFFRLERAP